MSARPSHPLSPAPQGWASPGASPRMRRLARTAGALLLPLLILACGGDSPPDADSGSVRLDLPFDDALPLAEFNYRGLVVMGLEERGFIPCGEDVPAWLEDGTGGELVDLYGALAGIPNEPLFAELRGIMGDPPSSGPGSRYAYGFRATAVRQLSFAPEAPECPEIVYGITARGNEPFWSVTLVVDGGEMRTPESPEPIVFVGMTERYEGMARMVTATHSDGRVLELELREEPCVDTMSGELFPFTAVRRWGGRSDPGCAWGEG